jgi:3D (Asp-Asp-Asp) domain-containing protein
VRAAASTSANVLTSLPQGSSVYVTGVGSEWSRISLSSGQIGYIYNTLLSDTKPAAPTSPPTSAPTSPPTAAPTTPPASGLSFARPGSASAAVHNLEQIRPYIRANGDKHYSSFTVNGNNTITVDGLTLAYQSVASYGMTHYDGLAVSVAMGETPPRNRSTASGIPAQRGLIAMKLPAYGGLPFGTVVFVEGYGLAVLADRGTLSSKTQVDLCYNAGESSYVRYYGWAMQRMFIISTP